MERQITFCTRSWNIGCQVIPFLTQNSGTSTELGLEVTPTRESRENCNWSAWCLPEWSAGNGCNEKMHDDVIKWKHFRRYWPFHRSPAYSPHKGHWRGALVFSLTCTWTKVWTNNRDAGDLRCHRSHYGVTVMAYYFTRLKYHRFSTIVWYLFYVVSITPDYYLKFIHLVLKHRYIPRDYVNINYGLLFTAWSLASPSQQQQHYWFAR